MFNLRQFFQNAMHDESKVLRPYFFAAESADVVKLETDWQSLGYGQLWQDLLKTATDANDVQQVKEAYITFSGAVLSSRDLSWQDRRGIVTLAQRRVKEIREARSADSLFDGMKGGDMFDEPLSDEEELEIILNGSLPSTSELLADDWID